VFCRALSRVERLVVNYVTLLSKLILKLEMLITAATLSLRLDYFRELSRLLIILISIATSFTGFLPL
jgi:hypothetical protein